MSVKNSRILFYIFGFVAILLIAVVHFNKAQAPKVNSSAQQAAEVQAIAKSYENKKSAVVEVKIPTHADGSVGLGSVSPAKMQLAESIKSKKKRTTQSDLLAEKRLVENSALGNQGWKSWVGAKILLASEIPEGAIVISRLGNLVVIQTDDEKFNWPKSSEKEKSVVFNDESQRIGYVTGKIKMFSSSPEQAYEAQGKIGFDIVKEFKHLNLYFVHCDNLNINLDICAEKIIQLGLKAEIEVVHQHYEKN